MIPLARALGAAGHEVRWAGAEEVCVRLKEKGFESFPSGRGANEVAPIGEVPPEIAALPSAERPNFLFSRSSARVALSRCSPTWCRSSSAGSRT